MRTLVLFRHAKSSWGDPGLTDHERPLTKRGTRDAARMGEFLAEAGLVPDLILCSGAVRARATLALALPAFAGAVGEVVHDDTLYLAEPAQILKRLANVEGSRNPVMIVGHNPGLHALALALVHAGEPRALSQLAQNFPTAGLAVIDFEMAGWSDVSPAAGTLRLFVSPKRFS
ncbi:MAG: histidine phosphatase family protein [Hyphomicrobiaceae bacterium]